MKFAAIALPLAAILASVAGTAQAEEEEGDAMPRLTGIEARLVYEQSGTLSVDITDNPDFSAFNTIIGEGSAAENANDLLIAAVIETDTETYTDAALVLTVRDSDGKELAQRVFDGMLLETKTHKFVYLEDAGCAGEITITAKLGWTVRTETINLVCGE